MTTPEVNAEADPLVEVGYELRWPLRLDRAGRIDAAAFDRLVGRFVDSVRETHPLRVALPQQGAPLQRALFRPHLELRSTGGDGPRLQLGPGLLGIGHAGSRSWKEMASSIALANDALATCTPEPLRPDRLSLRTVYAVSLVGDASLFDFLRERMNTSVSIDPALFADPMDARRPDDLRLAVAYPMRDVPGSVRLTLATGPDGAGAQALLVELEARVSGADAPPEPEAAARWADAAHDVLVHWFATLSRGGRLPGVTAPG